tara:strand:+ start:18623 stop:18835 length:213 start_codon:yes stop_codon:yes gene_type:complete
MPDGQEKHSLLMPNVRLGHKVHSSELTLLVNLPSGHATQPADAFKASTLEAVPIGQGMHTSGLSAPTVSE